jgi:hypothetical protein
MPGGRKTHEFPNGMPLPLLVVEIAFPVGIFILVVWFMKASFHSWREGALLAVVVITFMYIRWQLIHFYERKGLARPLRPRQ